MNIALIGATGFVGSAVLQELLQRGHRVTALARNPAKLAPREGLTVREADAQDAAQVARRGRARCRGQRLQPRLGQPAHPRRVLRGTRAIIDGTNRQACAAFWWWVVQAACSWRPACNWWTRPVPGRMEAGRTGRA
jgi:nucleoside-diphosphate-sugar epimerase